MTYKTILDRSFSRQEQKKLACPPFFTCFLVAFTLCTVFKSYVDVVPPPIVYLEQYSMDWGLKMLMSTEEISKPRQSYIDADEISPNPILRNFSNSRSQVYEMTGDIRIHGNSSTIVVASTYAQDTTSWTIKPYARKGDRVVMGKVRTFKIIPQAPVAAPHCTRNFSVPAIVFSGGGYAGNPFHDFTDVLIPLYLTSREFNRTVMFLVANKRSWWTSKYKVLLQNLSMFDVIDIDNEDQVLCFPKMIVGLKAHKEFSIDPSKPPYNYSATDFTKFLKSTYALERQFVYDCGHNHKNCSTRGRPRLLVVSRKKTRHLINEGEVADLGRSLGFDVVVREMGWQVSSVARFVNSFDVMVGVHGAGLTNMVFLPENAVVIQIVPLGLQFLAKHYFQLPAKDMKLQYLEYKVCLNESSLSGKHPAAGGEGYRDGVVVDGKGWRDFRSVYLDNQDVNVELDRFRGTLLKALELVRS
ncbi:Alpha-1,3-arabinosyltransferase XAT2 [Sesamum alatum]|uniref:Alpha-1,3-arabinosyltransferase XAT2 n=1 Tax=Sesamum alatum TaxID=300844 RepID=A0AAE1XLT9_9LAMI|nr:Alpha-1,3-arabinosyltransferase XAT2 [Sesamum alatum]